MSLLVSITVIPMLTARLLRVKKDRKDPFAFLKGGGSAVTNGRLISV